MCVSFFHVPMTKSTSWDRHGLLANINIPLWLLRGSKRYKISELVFFDRLRRREVFSDDPLLEFVPLQEGGVYTKADLRLLRRILNRFGNIRKVGYTITTMPDGTLRLKMSFTEHVFQGVDILRCFSASGGLGSARDEVTPTMDCRQIAECIGRRIEQSPQSILPLWLQEDVGRLLRNKGRMLDTNLALEIMERVEKWYHNAGYEKAIVTDFSVVDHDGSSEILCEIWEGHIKQLSMALSDKEPNDIGNSSSERDHKKLLQLIHRELPPEILPGNIYNVKAAGQAVEKLKKLGLFAEVEVLPRLDEEDACGLILDINLKLKQKEPIESRDAAAAI